MRITPDSIVYWHHGFIKLNATIVITWALMAGICLGAWLVTRRLSAGEKIPRWQNALEIIVGAMKTQLEQTGLPRADKYLPFLGTLFLFIAISALCTILPAYEPPTASLSTTVALAFAVFCAVPAFGISENGIVGYLKEYIQPSFLLLPINVLSEFTRTIALAVRLFGNAMSGMMFAAVVLLLAPLFFPILLSALELLIGVVQAYVFATLATVYIAAAVRTHNPAPKEHSYG